MSGDLIELIRVRVLTPLNLVKQELIQRESAQGPRRAFLWVSYETKFWSHDPNAGRTMMRIDDALGLMGQHFVRVGPRGEVLHEIEDWRGFIAGAEQNPGLFGDCGLAAFEAAHGDNSIHPFQPIGWSAHDWRSYEHALKRNLRRAA